MEKIARLCWNTNGWRRPSGKTGKSKANDSYENEMGFGHEEWLLDDSKIMPDGYHYGFLEPMRIKGTKHHGMIYDIHLYTISPNKQRIYIGCLKKAEGISFTESEKVYNYYLKKGWIEEMKQDIRFVDGVARDFTASFMFNVKFRFEDAEIYYSNQPILSPNSIPGHRYNFLDKKEAFVFEKNEDGTVKVLDTNIFDRVVQGGKIQIDPLHKKIQNACAKLLKSQYTNLQVESSSDSIAKQRVDIKGFSKNDKEWHFFEVKTMSAKRSIREALGQILEYTHYPNVNLAGKLFIIGPEPPDDKDKAYLQQLRKLYNLPIWFRWYSFAENKLYDGV